MLDCFGLLLSYQIHSVTKLFVDINVLQSVYCVCVCVCDIIKQVLWHYVLQQLTKLSTHKPAVTFRTTGWLLWPIVTWLFYLINVLYINVQCSNLEELGMLVLFTRTVSNNQ